MTRQTLPASLTRREFVTAGLALTAAAATGAPTIARPKPPAARSVILLWMDGGPSQLDTFDPKPEAPDGIRSGFATIKTRLPGVRVSELLPQTARILDRVTLIRTVCHEEGAHERACHLTLTGRAPEPSVIYPAIGSLVAHAGAEGSVPAYVAIGGRSHAAGYGNAGALGPAFDPWRIVGEPVGPLRLEAPNHAAHASGASLRGAFTWSHEPLRCREAYGQTTIGESCLLARRLVEVGVRFVTVCVGGWDTHSDGVRSLRWLVPPVDRALGALISGLDDSGMLADTLVVWMGEFGRTPRINALVGRDHWPSAGCCLIAGAGVPRGQVIGLTDSIAGEPANRPVHPSEIAATICAKLGFSLPGSSQPIPELC